MTYHVRSIKPGDLNQKKRRETERGVFCLTLKSILRDLQQRGDDDGRGDRFCREQSRGGGGGPETRLDGRNPRVRLRRSAAGVVELGCRSFYSKGYEASVREVSLCLLLTMSSYFIAAFVVLARFCRGVISGANLGDLAEGVILGANLEDLAEGPISGTNPGDLAERVISGTNPGDLAERVISGTNPRDLAEMVVSGINLGDLAERVISGANLGDLAEGPISGTNPGDLAERVILGINLGDLAEGLLCPQCGDAFNALSGLGWRLVLPREAESTLLGPINFLRPG
ncbi:hypothetical protein GW17_00003602 [Ensete ventricosum]|nr:hypothetical protein GW17_00003602 [Ensete ventricosum]